MTLIRTLKKCFLVTTVVFCIYISGCSFETTEDADTMASMGDGIDTGKIIVNEFSSDESNDTVSAMDVGEMMENMQSEDESGGFWSNICDFFANIWNAIVAFFKSIF